jgi:hypothetical protein
VLCTVFTPQLIEEYENTGPKTFKDDGGGGGGGR